MLTRVLELAAVAILGMMMLACGQSNPTATAAAPLAPPPPPAPKSEVDSFLATGPVVVENQLDLAAQREGIVDKIMAEPGTPVRKGQLLASLDDRQISADLEAARAKARSIEADLKNWEAEAKVLESDYQRAQKMWDAQLITKEQLEHAKYKAESDQWDVKRVQEQLVNAREAQRSLELELEKTRVRAPFGGMVARRYVRVGQRVAVGDRLFWVTATAPLRVKFTLPENFLGHLKPGAELLVSSAELQDSQYRARVVEVSPVVDPASGTIEVLAQLVGPTGQLRPGMSAQIRLPRPQ
jgi:RND family efflux transporter MFP subunit